MNTDESGLEIAPGRVVPEGLLEFTFARSGGPGGQNVNKVETKAILRVALESLRPVLGNGALSRLRTLAATFITDEGDLLLTASESRSQVANRHLCLDKLRDLLVESLRVPKVRRPTRPSRSSRARRMQSKSQRGATKSLRRRPTSED